MGSDILLFVDLEYSQKLHFNHFFQLEMETMTYSYEQVKTNLRKVLENLDK